VFRVIIYRSTSPFRRYSRLCVWCRALGDIIHFLSSISSPERFSLRGVNFGLNRKIPSLRLVSRRAIFFWPNSFSFFFCVPSTPAPTDRRLLRADAPSLVTPFHGLVCLTLPFVSRHCRSYSVFYHLKYARQQAADQDHHSSQTQLSPRVLISRTWPQLYLPFILSSRTHALHVTPARLLGDVSVTTSPCGLFV
jgi:hypothetical protein